MQPYNKSSILLNTPIEYSKRYLYTYEWYINNQLVSTDPNYTYLFPKNGIYNIKLIVTDKDSGLKTTTLKTLETIIPNEKKSKTIPPGITPVPLNIGSGGTYSRNLITTKTSANIQTVEGENLSTTDTDWVTASDPICYGGAYRYNYGGNGTRVLTGTLTIPHKSLICVVYNQTTDSAAFIATVGSATLNIPAGSAAIGWTTTVIGNLSSGTYSITLTWTTPPAGKFCYIDAIIVLPVLDSSNLLNSQEFWTVDNKAFLYDSAAWSKELTATNFPYNVVATIPPYSLYSASMNSTITFSVEVPAGSTGFNVHGKTGADQGIAEVHVDGSLALIIDQYQSNGNLRAKWFVTAGVGLHLVTFVVAGAKNPSSSGFTVNLNAISITPTLTDTERILEAADYISSCVRTDDCGIRISFDSDLYNQDNDDGYSLMTLALIAYRYGQPQHKLALQRGLEWFANIADIDSIWHWGYNRAGFNNYIPTVNDYYSSLTPPITDIQCIDAPQSFPVVALALYAAAFPGDMAFVNLIKDKIVSGLDTLITRNLDPTNGFFYSSWQYFPTDGGWRLYEAQYSAGQADVYMALRSAYALTGYTYFKTIADRILANFDAAFWSPTLNCYSVGLFGPMGGTKVRDDSYYYPFAQGYPIWVFGASNLSHATAVLTTNKSWIQGDGYSVIAPGSTDAETGNSSWLYMGLKAAGTDSTIQTNLKQKIRIMQNSTYPYPEYGNGFIGFSTGLPAYSYIGTAAWALLALGGEAPAATWW